MNNVQLYRDAYVGLGDLGAGEVHALLRQRHVVSHLQQQGEVRISAHHHLRPDTRAHDTRLHLSSFVLL